MKYLLLSHFKNGCKKAPQY